MATLVVETSGFNGKSWLDTAQGHPYTEALHVTERFRRTDFGNLEIDFVADDSRSYSGGADESQCPVPHAASRPSGRLAARWKAGLVAVGTTVAHRPPHRPVLALLTHTVPTSDIGMFSVKAYVRIRLQDLHWWKQGSQTFVKAFPRKATALAPAS